MEGMGNRGGDRRRGEKIGGDRRRGWVVEEEMGGGGEKIGGGDRRRGWVVEEMGGGGGEKIGEGECLGGGDGR